MKNPVTIIRENIEAEMIELCRSVAQDFGDLTLKQSREACEYIKKKIEELKAKKQPFAEELHSEFLEMSAKTEMFRNSRQAEDFKATLAMDLMHCPNRFVVTDTEQLFSPAGCAFDSRVFQQTAIAIHTDSLENLPSSNRKLYAHDITKICSR